MTNWLQLAKDEIAKLPKHTTANTDNRYLTSVLAVPNIEEFEIFNDADGSIVSTSSELLNNFFDNAAGLNINLLHDDKRWFYKVCFGISLPRLKALLSLYANYWLDTMDLEVVVHKKQNVGRYRANTMFRQTIILK